MKRIAVNLELTVWIEVPAHWVAVGSKAADEAIEEDALGAVQEGEHCVSRLVDWSFA